MSSAQDPIASNGGDVADSMDQLKLSDEPRLGPDGEPAPKTDEEYAATQLTLRAIVSSKEAGVIIGKGGKNVADLRDETGVKAGVSKVVQGVHDRVLTITGGCDAISRAYAVVARALLEGAPAMGMGGVISNNGTHCMNWLALPLFHMPPLAMLCGSLLMVFVAIKLLISHNQMGTIIGRQGLKIKNIQDVSGVRMVAQKEMLPQSTERIVEVQGAPEGIQRAIWEICKCLVDDWQRATGTVLYNPVVRTQTTTGGATSSMASGAGGSSGGYGTERSSYSGPRVTRTGNGADFSNGGPRSYNRRSDSDAATRGPPTHDENGEEIQTQNISIPADMVGCIIGRAGSKISEIRKTSGARISIAKVSLVPPVISCDGEIAPSPSLWVDYVLDNVTLTATTRPLTTRLARECSPSWEPQRPTRLLSSSSTRTSKPRRCDDSSRPLNLRTRYQKMSFAVPGCNLAPASSIYAMRLPRCCRCHVGSPHPLRGLSALGRIWQQRPVLGHFQI
jgi:heterogeneous nuclear rnp K-like protein 2